MEMHRFTRPTNTFSKKVDNHCQSPALYFLYFNFVRIHKGSRSGMRWPLASPIDSSRSTTFVTLIDARDACRTARRKDWNADHLFKLRHYRNMLQLSVAPQIG
jgi:hypothetical protein